MDDGLSNPPLDPLGAAVDWVRSTLLGSAAMSVEILAVAVLGLLLLSGRVPVRRGILIVLGCFIVISASSIANGIIGAAGPADAATVASVSTAAPSYTPAIPPAVPYDPYAGAAVPVRPPSRSDGPQVR